MKFSNFLNYVAAILIAGALISMIVIIIKSYPNVSRVDINVKIAKAPNVDTFKRGNSYIIIDGVDSLNSIADSIELKVKQLETVRQDILRLKTEESSNNLLYTALTALIIAIAGFFGFKSMHDIKDKSKEIAEEKAKEIAREVAREKVEQLTRDEVYAKQFQNMYDNASKVYEKDIVELKNRMSAIESDLQELKGKQNPPSTEAPETGNEALPDQNNKEVENL